MSRRQHAFLALLAALLGSAVGALAAPAQGAAGGRAPRRPAIAGRYDSPLGQLEVAVRGASVTGKLVAPARSCPFTAGDEVLRGTVLDDSIAGQLRVWLRGDGCKRGEAWGNAVLLVGQAGLSGAVHVEDPACATPLGPKGGVTLARLDAGGRAPASAGGESARARRERARTVIKDGAAWL